MTGELASALAGLDLAQLRQRFQVQGSFLFLPQFLPPAVTGQLLAGVAAVAGVVNRNYLPGHKQGGSVSRYTIDELAPAIAQLYRSRELLGWLSALTGQPSSSRERYSCAIAGASSSLG